MRRHKWLKSMETDTNHFGYMQQKIIDTRHRNMHRNVSTFFCEVIILKRRLVRFNNIICKKIFESNLIFTKIWASIYLSDENTYLKFADLKSLEVVANLERPWQLDAPYLQLSRAMKKERKKMISSKWQGWFYAVKLQIQMKQCLIEKRIWSCFNTKIYTILLLHCE